MSIYRGLIVAVSGPSGVGKSSLVKHICPDVDPEVGSISKNARRTLTVFIKNRFFMRIPSKKINCAAILSQDAEKCKCKKWDGFKFQFVAE